MTMNDSMLDNLSKKNDGIDGLTKPIDDLAMLGEGSALATIGGETGGSVMTGTECEVERDHTLVMAGVESDLMLATAMAGGSEF